jgi:hypothetical protein
MATAFLLVCVIGSWSKGLNAFAVLLRGLVFRRRPALVQDGGR